MISGMRIIESLYLVEDGWAWLPLGRSGWKGKCRVKVPYQGALQIDANTIIMHPTVVRQLRDAQAKVDAEIEDEIINGRPGARVPQSILHAPRSYGVRTDMS